MVKAPDFRLRLGTTISGRVTDGETGLPIANVDIVADPLHKAGSHSYARTDSGGRYMLEGVAPGNYTIKVRANRQGYIQEYYNDKLHSDDANLVTIRGLEVVEGIDFDLTPGATISGRVIDAETGLPIANMEVRAGLIDGDYISWANTDGNGNYVLTALPDGVIEVVMYGQGYIEVRRTVTIREGVDVTGFDF